MHERIGNVRFHTASPGFDIITITLPHDMAAVVKGAVEGGDYASSSEVVREALLGADGPTGTFTCWENETIPW